MSKKNEQKGYTEFKEKQFEPLSEIKEPFVALKDFEIHHNDYHRVIKVGENLSDVPEKYFENLKTEKVI